MKLYNLLFTGLLLISNVVMSDESSLSVRAMLEPVKEARIASELSGRVSKVSVKNGDAFTKGELLVAFDCELYQADLQSAMADLDAAKTHLENKQHLFQLRSAGQIEVKLARYELDRMNARVRSTRYITERCQVNAPFNGRVVEVAVNEHESVAPGTEMIWLLDDSRLEVNLVLPSNWLQWLKPGQPFLFSVDETGGRYPGSVIRIGARVDAVSQSVRVTGVLTKKQDALMAGMSGSALFVRE